MRTNPNLSYYFYIVVFLCSVLFALGLQISGMVDPQKVLGFLSISRQWDPSLALVLFAALVVFYLGYHYLIKPRINTQQPSILGMAYQLPKVTELDKPLMFGAAIFGIGWGLAGLCPGPAIVNLVHLDANIFAFVAAMLVGIKVSQLYKNP